MPTRNIADAEKTLQDAFLRIKARFDAAFELYEVRPTTVYRSPDEQLIEFRAKRSNCDGTRVLSNHNHKPSRAIDVGIFRVGDGAYLDDLVTKGSFDREHAFSLYWNFGLLAQREGLRWGGDWNGNGLPVEPDPAESLNDIYHIELKVSGK